MANTGIRPNEFYKIKWKDITIHNQNGIKLLYINVTKIFQYMLTNIYHTVYGKHQSLHTKEQMKYLAVAEYGKSASNAHLHILHKPFASIYNENKLIDNAKDFIRLSNDQSSKKTTLDDKAISSAYNISFFNIII